MTAFKPGKLFYWIMLVSAIPMAVSSILTTVGIEANDNRTESIIYFSFSIAAYLIIVGIKGINRYLIITTIAIILYTIYSIARGNNIPWAIIDAALIFQFAIHLATAKHILNTTALTSTKQQFLASSIILLLTSLFFIMILDAKTASIDHLSPSLLLSATSGYFIIPTVIVLMAASISAYSVFGIFKISIAIQLSVISYILIGGLKVGKHITSAIAITVVIGLIAFLSTMPIEQLEHYASMFTNRVSSEIRFNELRFLFNRDLYLNLFGGGFGYASSFREFINYEEFSNEGRLRVFHFGFTWVFAKFGYLGIILIIFYTIYMVYKCSILRLRRLESLFIISMVLVCLASLHLTFGWTMKNYLMPLSLALLQRHSR